MLDLSAVATLAGVTKRLGGKPVLDGLDLAIRAGEVTALIGPNGAGKSTSVGLLTGRLTPDAGEAQLFGLDPRRPAARGRIGVMLQAAGLPDVMTVREVIALQSGYYVDSLPVAETLELAGLADMAERRRYCLDIARELYFLEVRKKLRTTDSGQPYPASESDRSKVRSNQAGSKEKGYSMGDSLRFWQRERQIAKFEQQYNDGRLKEAATTLEQIQ